MPFATRPAFARALARIQPYRADLGLPPLAEPPAPTVQDFERQFEAVLEARPAAFSFIFGLLPAPMVAEARRRGIALIGTATTVEEAEALEENGVDFVCASGFEAGGHRGSFLRPAEQSLTGTLALVPQVVSAVRVPVQSGAEIRLSAAALARHPPREPADPRQAEVEELRGLGISLEDGAPK